jgi:hypothetical protein
VTQRQGGAYSKAWDIPTGRTYHLRMTEDPSRTSDKHDEQPAHERSDKTTDYEDPIDDASDDSFPASDPPSFTDSTATRNPER